MFWYVISSIVMALGGILVYVYFLRSGQFEDPEEPKYQMFRDEEE